MSSNLRRPVLVIALALASCSPQSSQVKTSSAAKDSGQARESVIYGDDNRRDLFEEANPAYRSLADSTVALIRNTSLSKDPALGQYLIKGINFGASYSLCQDEPYREQDTAAFCSGFLIGPDLIATAGHCVPSQEACEETAFVFGFAYNFPNIPPLQVHESEVYSCKNLIHSVAINSGADFAVLKLDREVKGHQPLKVRLNGQIQKDDDLMVIGYPSGLPVKIADGAKVRDPSPKGFFVANLDTYGGNSGSAVFNSRTFEVEGILVRGERDFQWKPSQNCMGSNICPTDGCRGEDVTKIEEALAHVPAP